MKKSSVPKFEIRRAPIEDLIFCAKFVAHKRADASKLLVQLLVDVGAVVLQVALLLLRQMWWLLQVGTPCYPRSLNW